MKTIFHLKDSIKRISANDFTKDDLQSILLDLFYSDSKRMGKRCKVEILEEDEHLRHDEYVQLESKTISECERTLFINKDKTNICQYKKRRKSND